ncbi:hypothetical protein [Lacticaseibacillus brantae]|nr:hypothetical protein [Lacticaseibacillus brantae]
MNEENDVILRQVKSFAEGLGYMLSKKSGGKDDVAVIFEDREIDLGPYHDALKQEIKTHGIVAASQLLESWRTNRIKDNQYEQLFNWLQEERFGLDSEDR